MCDLVCKKRATPMARDICTEKQFYALEKILKMHHGAEFM
jgi:hypothetical protein